MEGVRIRLIDVAAALLWMLMVWFFVRAGVENLTVLHIWGLATGAIAGVVTVWAVVTCATGKVLGRVAKMQSRDIRRIESMLD